MSTIFDDITPEDFFTAYDKYFINVVKWSSTETYNEFDKVYYSQNSRYYEVKEGKTNITSTPTTIADWTPLLNNYKRPFILDSDYDTAFLDAKIRHQSYEKRFNIPDSNLNGAMLLIAHFLQYNYQINSQRNINPFINSLNAGGISWGKDMSSAHKSVFLEQLNNTEFGRKYHELLRMFHTRIVVV